jgi:hypothetical protein
MVFELLALIVTGVLSFMDLVVNIFGLCMTGHCESDCCGCFTFEHNEKGEQQPEFTFTESVLSKLSGKKTTD